MVIRNIYSYTNFAKNCFLHYFSGCCVKQLCSVRNSDKKFHLAFPTFHRSRIYRITFCVGIVDITVSHHHSSNSTSNIYDIFDTIGGSNCSITV